MKRSEFDSDRRGPLRQEDGATAVEFALLAPVLISMILFILQIGLALHKGNTVQWAVNKAARAALLNPTLDESDIADYVNARLDTIDPLIEVEIAYSVTTVGTATIGNISGTYFHEVAVPFLPSFTAEFDIDVSVPRS